mmetsp:Transcript_18573/g.26055  ORF Transcript_18573/g.26055 Transcript_18573/m.26055 type:complete len:248 (-) Transcript_18573:223-966(-)|eukprot:CAMPEP_0175094620 /NCGR_PEP_ID=MMETSP0086_2-20121207/3691_1 /TAXON_ID=136419 /ORGANISM="Unknown Unknown, Strain D1" /LENGTH=247 /DNA_ID=CAMNT_0016367757 /DNA_START=59 /DNA_END=802 /DNA_ORIENTATION=+
MDNSEASAQIKQMIAFIRQEAKEKADEIAVKTDQECTAKKMTLKIDLIKKLTADHERKVKDQDIQKKIQRSKEVNNARVAKMRGRHDKMGSLKTTVLSELANVSKNPQYSQLILYLLIQGLINIIEEEVTVQCRKEDRAIVEGQLAPAVAQYKAAIAKETGITPNVSLALDTEEFLPPGPSPNVQGQTCCGGVVLYAKNRKIICRNTLDSRLDLAFEELKPTIRAELFGVRGKPVNAFCEGDEKKDD